MKFKFSFFIIIIFIVLFLSIFIFKNVTKISKSGNNMSSQEIVDNLLNLNMYKSKVFVQVNSNKNQNKYVLLQEYNTEQGCVQEVVEPENIAGLKITKKDDKLSLQNSNLNLSTVFENYTDLEDNCLDLNYFLQEYKNNSNSSFDETDNDIIMKVSPEKNNKYLKNMSLYINKESFLPTKLLIKDVNQNTTIIIEYYEIELF